MVLASAFLAGSAVASGDKGDQTQSASVSDQGDGADEKAEKAPADSHMWLNRNPTLDKKRELLQGGVENAQRMGGEASEAGD